MSDGQMLLAVFGLLYLVECLRLLPSGAWMAAGTAKTRWNTLRTWARFHISAGSPMLLSVLPPMRAHVLGLPFDLVPEADALRANLGAGVKARIPWQNLRLSVEETTLHLDATTRLRLPSAARAHGWKQRIEEWREMAWEQRRNAFLKVAGEALCCKSAASTAADAATRTCSIRRLATAHFIWCFGVITAVYWRLGDSPALLATLVGLLLLQLTQAWLFLRSSRPLKHLVPHRRWRALGIALLPQLTLRAADAVSLAADHEPPHPLAWRGMLDSVKWLDMARVFWREARYVPGWSQTQELAPEAEALQSFFKQESVPPADYDPPATGRLPACPRCRAEFQPGVKCCSDCGGVELRMPDAE